MRTCCCTTGSVWLACWLTDCGAALLDLAVPLVPTADPAVEEPLPLLAMSAPPVADDPYPLQPLPDPLVAPPDAVAPGAELPEPTMSPHEAASPETSSLHDLLIGGRLIDLGRHELASTVRALQLERLQKLDQIRLLSGGELQREQAVVVIHDGEQIGRAAVVKIRRMLPQPAQRRRPVFSGRRSGGIARIRPDLGRIVQERHPSDRDRSGRR